jgi:hypothetical protein
VPTPRSDTIGVDVDEVGMSWSVCADNVYPDYIGSLA